MIDLAAATAHLPPELRSPPPVELKELDRDGIKVIWRFQETLVESQRVRFYGGVRALYGQTLLECEELILDFSNQSGRAIGKVKVTDPEGTIDAENLVFNWKEKTGQAENVRAQVAGMRLQMDRADIKPGVWELSGVRGTPSRTRPPEFELTARKLVLRPGQSGRAIRPGFSVFGVPLGTIPSYSFSLDRRVIGLRIPAASFRRGQGVGFAWGSAFLIDPGTSLTLKTNVLPKSYPLLAAEIARSEIDPEKSVGRLSTRTDMGDRLFDSWIDSVLVPNRDREPRALRAPKSQWSIGSYWGQATRGRLADSETVSKPFDLVYERNTRIGQAGLFSQLRFQQARGARGERYETRAVAQVVGHSGMVSLGEGLGLYFRWDGNAYLGSQSEYAWGRLAGVVVWQPNSRWTLGVSPVVGFETGAATFEWDRPLTLNAVHGRADFRVGPYAASGLVKYDFNRRDVISVEYSLSVLAGSFEPFFTYRQTPRELQFGLRLRTTDFFDLLSNRRIERRPASAPNEQGAGPKPSAQ